LAAGTDIVPGWRESVAEWQALVERDAEVPLFVGRDWVESWLEVHGPALNPSLWQLREGSDLVGACLLVEQREKRGPIPVRCLYLNTAGEPEGEGVCVEYNELVAAPGRRADVARALAREIVARGADELAAGGITERTYEALTQALPGWDSDVEWSEDAFVDLAGLRIRGADYRQSVLSGNSRKQINRSLKAYEQEVGPLEVEVAATAARRLELLDELIELHQATWRARGEGGAFGGERMRDFHRRFIERSAPADAAQLVRVSAGDETIGVLYNFVDRGRVFFYQSGLHYRESKKLRPGLSAHVCAIEHYLAEGLDEYHFLAGDQTTPRYKQSLSNDVRRLAWVRFQRPGLKTSSIRVLRAIKAKLSGGHRDDG
jgi:CelD/BcsL family acetyltransferase involved in cellulose biosynthesis